MWEPKRPARPRKSGGAHRCKACHGAGQLPGITKITGMGSGAGSAFGVCPDCDGTGWTDRDAEDHAQSFDDVRG